MYLDVPEDQREGFEDLSAPVNLMLEARGEQPAS